MFWSFGVKEIVVLLFNVLFNLVSGSINKGAVIFVSDKVFDKNFGKIIFIDLIVFCVLKMFNLDVYILFFYIRYLNRNFLLIVKNYFDKRKIN